MVCLTKKVRPAGMTVEQLQGVALGLNAAVVGKLETRPVDRFGRQCFG